MKSTDPGQRAHLTEASITLTEVPIIFKGDCQKSGILKTSNVSIH